MSDEILPIDPNELHSKLNIVSTQLNNIINTARDLKELVRFIKNHLERFDNQSDFNDWFACQISDITDNINEIANSTNDINKIITEECVFNNN